MHQKTFSNPAFHATIVEFVRPKDKSEIEFDKAELQSFSRRPSIRRADSRSTKWRDGIWSRSVPNPSNIRIPQPHKALHGLPRKPLHRLVAAQRLRRRQQAKVPHHQRANCILSPCSAKRRPKQSRGPRPKPSEGWARPWGRTSRRRRQLTRKRTVGR